MSTYSQYGANSFSDDIVANESYDGIVGAYTAVEENAVNEHRIFESIIGRDFTEAYVAAGALDESALEAVNEASLGGIWEKVKAFFKKMAEKIAGVIKSIKDRIVIAFTRDGKELVKKYDKQIVRKINDHKMTHFTYTFYSDFNDTLKGSSDISVQIKALVNNSDAYKKLDTEWGNAKKTYDKGLSTGDAASQEKDAYKTLTEDELTEYKEKAYGQCCGDSSVTNRKELIDKLTKEVKDNADETEGLDSAGYARIKSALTDGQKFIKSLENAESKVKKLYKDAIKNCEEMQREANKTKSNTDYKANAAEVNMHATNTIRLGNILTTVATDLLTAHTSQAQMIYKNARSIFTRAATYGGKDEAAFMEAVSQVSDYEADQIFE